MSEKVVDDHHEILRRVFDAFVLKHAQNQSDHLDLRYWAASVGIQDLYEYGCTIGVFRQYNVITLRAWTTVAVWASMMQLVVHRYHGLEAQYRELLAADEFISRLDVCAGPLIDRAMKEITYHFRRNIPTTKCYGFPLDYMTRSVRYYGGYLDMVDAFGCPKAKPWPKAFLPVFPNMGDIHLALNRLHTKLTKSGPTGRRYRDHYWPPKIRAIKDIGLSPELHQFASSIPQSSSRTSTPLDLSLWAESLFGGGPCSNNVPVWQKFTFEGSIPTERRLLQNGR
ncbi:hypothetical protein KEM56_000045 [Ascosphaera pollenicola]|nr:hypothetical protein KEM56_000045 [Ascosphaera pollenicola]